MGIKQKAFTLIELSIVIVIIGFVIGGVMVGRDLIRASDVRSTIGQYEKIFTAINTFRLKYNALPGDMHYSQAAAAGLFTFTGGLAGTANYGDGNGYINSECAREGLVFWRQLSDTQLIEGSYGNDASNPIVTTSGVITNDASPVNFLPGAKLANGLYFMASSYSAWTDMGQRNYIGLIGYPTITNAGSCTRQFFVPPRAAYEIDLKIDNGRPGNGRIYSQGAVFGQCASAVSGEYIKNSDDPSTGCGMFYRF